MCAELDRRRNAKYADYFYGTFDILSVTNNCSFCCRAVAIVEQEINSERIGIPSLPRYSK
jgi:hypothetical protein